MFAETCIVAEYELKDGPKTILLFNIRAKCTIVTNSQLVNKEKSHLQIKNIFF